MFSIILLRRRSVLCKELTWLVFICAGHCNSWLIICAGHNMSLNAVTLSAVIDLSWSMSASSLPVAVWFWEASGRVGPMSVCKTLASRLNALSVSGVGAPRLATTSDCSALAANHLATVWYIFACMQSCLKVFHIL